VQVQLILILLVALALIMVTVQNPNPVSLQFLSWQAHQIPLIIIMLISLLGGVVIASLLSVRKQSRLKGRIRQLEDQLDELRKSPPGPHEDRLDR
jgi:uncharacterized integral membrane protein